MLRNIFNGTKYVYRYTKLSSMIDGFNSKFVLALQTNRTSSNDI